MASWMHRVGESESRREVLAAIRAYLELAESTIKAHR